MGPRKRTLGFRSRSTLEHLPCPSPNPLLERSCRNVEPHDERRPARLLRPEPVRSLDERAARLGHLERPHDAAAVVWVHGRSSDRIDRDERRVRAPRVAVVAALPGPPRLLVDRGRDLQVAERRAEVQAGTAGDDGDAPCLDDLVDRRVREVGVLGDGHVLVEISNGHEPGRGDGLIREDRKASVDLERIRRDDLRSQARREPLGDGGLPGCRRPEDREDVVVHRGHAPWGTPAHHPLRS